MDKPSELNEFSVCLLIVSSYLNKLNKLREWITKKDKTLSLEKELLLALNQRQFSEPIFWWVFWIFFCFGWFRVFVLLLLWTFIQICKETISFFKLSSEINFWDDCSSYFCFHCLNKKCSPDAPEAQVLYFAKNLLWNRRGNMI